MLMISGLELWLELDQDEAVHVCRSTCSLEYGFVGARARRNTDSSEWVRRDHVRREHVHRERVRRRIPTNAFPTNTSRRTRLRRTLSRRTRLDEPVPTNPYSDEHVLGRTRTPKNMYPTNPDSNEHAWLPKIHLLALRLSGTNRPKHASTRFPGVRTASLRGTRYPALDAARGTPR